MSEHQFPQAKKFSGTIFETDEKVSGTMEIYAVSAAGLSGTISRFLLSKRLEKSHLDLFYTVILENGKKYCVYINDKQDTLIQKDIEIFPVNKKHPSKIFRFGKK